MKLNAMALTAGLGTRMAPYSQKIAKPAIPFLGVPLLIHALRPTECLSLTSLVVNIHHRPDDIRNVCERIRARYPIYFSDEKPKILGSGGGIAQARRWLETEEHFLVINGDEIFIPPKSDFLQTAFEHHVKSGNLCTLITIDHPEVGKKFGGVWTDDDLRVVRFSQKPVPDTTGLHYVGYAFFHRRVFEFFSDPVQEENILYDVLMRAMVVGERVYAFKTVAHWFEMGNPVDFIRATERMITIYEKNVTSDLSRNFARFLRKNQPWSVLIENEFQNTLQKVNKLLDSVKNG